MISVTPDEGGGSTETTLVAIPLENSNSSKMISDPLCVYVLPKIDDQIPIRPTASYDAPIPNTKIYVHYNPLSVTSSNIEVYTSQSRLYNSTVPAFYHSGDYTERCASNERSCGNFEDLAEPPAMLKYRTESVESDDTDAMAIPLLPRSTQQTPVALNCRTSGRNDKSMDDEKLVCPNSLSAKDSHPRETSILLSSSTLLPRVDLLREITYKATESMQDYNCARSFSDCPPCASSGSDGGGGGTPQLRRAEEEILEDSCGSNVPLNVLPQLNQSDSRICDYGYTGGRAISGYFSDEREINSRPAAKLSSIDSWQS